MSYETRPNSGSLFSNKGKPIRSENGPDYSGTANVDGVEYWMDSWIKTAQDGKKWMSFSFKSKQKPGQQAAPVGAKAQRAPFEDMDSDIPF